VPAGAIPKDGPSAGVAMATALASMYSRHAARSDTAMTGEITLTGLVLPVGGIKEKMLAARRAGIHRVIIPEQNGKDLQELPEEVRAEMEFILAGRIEDVLASAIPGLVERLAGAAHVTIAGQGADDGNGRIAASGRDAAGESKNRSGS
jgi:ATP-dependent Lon protease